MGHGASCDSGGKGRWCVSQYLLERKPRCLLVRNLMWGAKERVMKADLEVFAWPGGPTAVD